MGGYDVKKGPHQIVIMPETGRVFICFEHNGKLFRAVENIHNLLSRMSWELRNANHNRY